MAKNRQTFPLGLEEARALYGTGEDRAEARRGKAGRRRRAGTVPLSRGLRRLTRILSGIACGLALVILAGTLYALFRDSADPVPEGFTRGGAAGEDSGPGEPEIAVFTGIGRLRIATASSGADSAPRAVLLLSVVFPYPPEDRAFTEELAGKVSLFRRIIRDYFGAFSRDELNSLDEQRAKDELLRRFNGELQLGKIESLLFNELVILE
ncbi:MAG: hypothetical protein LBG07_07500 [Treponema sp.]|nr:hypothetical protein [Treponema sp.]